MEQQNPEQSSSSPSPTPHAPVTSPGPVGHMPQVHEVWVTAKPGGLWRAFSIVGGLMLFAIVFLIGIVFGFAAALTETPTVVEQTYRDSGRERIVILPIEGVIGDDAARFARIAVNHILDDRHVRAVVLRVDSPGGGVTASDQIWYQVKRLRDAGLPVIASYGGVAASGGYYVSCNADYIFAEQTCITGSIGVIAQLFTMNDLMGKVGIEPVTIVATDSPEKDIANNIFRTWDERDRQRILAILDSAQATFINRVRDGRSHVITDDDRLTSLANGAIFTAQQAVDNQLIDAVGYLDDAIAHAEQSAGLRAGRASVVRIGRPPQLFGGMLAREGGAGSTIAAMDAERLRGFINELASPRAMYLMH
jgi:protease IV